MIRLPYLEWRAAGDDFGKLGAGRFRRRAPGIKGGLLLAGMVARTSTCLRRLAGGRRSGIVGFSRFLANPRVTVEALLDGWGSMAGARSFRKAARAGIFWRSRTPAKSFSRRPESAVAVWARSARVRDAVFCCTRCWVLMPKRAAFWAWPRAGCGHGPGVDPRWPGYGSSSEPAVVREGIEAVAEHGRGRQDGSAPGANGDRSQ